MSCLWKQCQDESLHHKTFTKKALGCFWFPAGGFNISNIFYKIQNFKLMASFSINHSVIPPPHWQPVTRGTKPILWLHICGHQLALPNYTTQQWAIQTHQLRDHTK